MTMMTCMVLCCREPAKARLERDRDIGLMIVKPTVTGRGESKNDEEAIERKEIRNSRF